MIDQTISGIQIYKRLLKSAMPYWWAFLLGILGNILIAASDGYMTWGLKLLVDKGFNNRDEHFIYYLPHMIIGFFVVRAMAYFIASYFMTWVGRSVVRDFRQKMISHLMFLPAVFYDQKTLGELLSKINYDTDQVADAISEGITSTIRGVLTALSLMVVMFTLNARITILLLIAVPLLGIYINRISARMRQQSAKIQDSMGRVSHIASEIINSHKIIQIFGGMDYENQRFEAVTKQNFHEEMRMAATAGYSVAGMQFIGVCALVVFIYLATLPLNHFFETAMDAGTFVSMTTALLGLLRPIKQVALVNSILQRGIAGAKSIFALLDETTEQDDGLLSLARAKGDIRFQQVSFHYPLVARQESVLKSITFSVKAGETVAIVGRSGSGKTTLVSLLPRFYDCVEGEISLDGHNIQSYKLADLRRQFAFVSQQIFLFNDSIFNNIAYGATKNASMDEVLQATDLAHALEFIERLPMGFQTEVGENGIRLSGGQRQRIAIARAILKNAPILILDEATSALDRESESYIQSALEVLMRGRTTFVIAHRLSTIENADKVLVLEDGMIIECGTHQELLIKNGRYAELHKAQFKGSLFTNTTTGLSSV